MSLNAVTSQICIRLFMAIMSCYLIYPVVIFGQENFIQKQFEEGMAAKAGGDIEKALDLWGKAADLTEIPPYFLAVEYIKLVAGESVTTDYETATQMIYRALNGNVDHTADHKAFEEDLLYLELLMTPEDFEKRFVNKNENELPQAVRLFWESADPLPTTPSNPRLIEHYSRVDEAIEQFPDENSPFGFDDRGKAWVRYGEPDKKLDRKLEIDYSALQEFMIDYAVTTETSADPDGFSLAANFSGSSENGSSASGSTFSGTVTPEAVLIALDLFVLLHKELDIWVYQDVELESKNNLILFFESEDEVKYKQIDALDDWIPRSMLVGTKESGIFNFPPGSVIQHIFYKKLTGFDPYFGFVSNRVDHEMFNIAPSRHYMANLTLATKIKQENVMEANKIRESAPPGASSEERKIPSIPLEVHQYRLLNTDDEPVLATFVESRPAAAFLSDLTASQEEMMPNEEDDIIGELSRWYRLRQNVDLRDGQGRLAGRLRSLPELPLDEQDRVPAASLLTIPHLPDSTTQHFYVTLENTHPETNPPQESVFPDELRGLGRLAVPQPVPMDLSGDGPILGDLLLGYGRMNQSESGLRFPFIASHERTIPEGENLVVHFEAYRLQTDGQGFANFEVRYEIESKQGLFGRLLANRDNLSGTLSFEPRAGRFAESLEFEELSLEPGKYTLHWTVRDLLSEQDTRQAVEFEVDSTDE